MSIAEKLTSVANNVPKVYMAGASDFGLIGQAIGSPVTLNNVHPIEHTINVKLESKNLFDYEDFIRRWDNGEYYESNGYFVLGIQFKPNTKYYLKANGTRGGGVVLISTLESVNTDYDCAIGVSDTWDAERTVTTTASGKIYIGAPVVEYVTRELFETALVQIEYGEAPTAYTPHISDFSEVKVTARGKNLLDITNPLRVPTPGYEIIDGTILRAYGKSGITGGDIVYRVYAPQGTELHITFDYELGGEATGKWFILTSGNNAVGLNSGNTFTISDTGYIELGFCRSGGSGNNKLGWVDIKNLQVEVGTTATEYEPYREAEYTANADGSVEGVRSISPVMNLSADNEGVNLFAECFLDPKAIVNELSTAIISLGGEI